MGDDPDGNGTTGGLRERLHQQARAIGEIDRFRDLTPPPPWDGLVIRFRPLSFEQYRQTQQAVTSAVQAEDDLGVLRANLDMIAAACDHFRYRTGGDGSSESLADLLRGEGDDVRGEIRFDQQAIRFLGLEVSDPDSVHAIIRAVYAGAEIPDVAVANHADLLVMWMAGAHRELQDRLVGGL